jgi:amino acid adenylation domain-containing protein
MTSTGHFLARLRERNIKLWIEGDRLRCSAPTGALTAELKEEVAARKSDILSALAAEQDRERLPLTAPQRMMWLLERLRPGDPAYHVVLVIRIGGPLDRKRLEESLNALVRRHEGLRLAISDDEGQPYGTIMEPWRPALAFEDLSALEKTARDNELRERIGSFEQAPFDLSEGRPLRAMLFLTGAGEHMLALGAHHIAADGWAASRLTHDLARIYAGDEELPPAGSLREAMRSAGGRPTEPAERFWRQALAGLSARLALPARCGRDTDTRTRVRFAVPPALVRRLRETGGAEKASLFVVVLTAVAELLRRYSGQEDFVIGTPFANRMMGNPDLVADFVTTLPLRCDLSGSPTVHDALQRVRSMALDAIEHSSTPFEEIAPLLPKAQFGADPLPCFVAVHEIPSANERLSSLDWQLVDLEDEHTWPKTDLSIELGSAVSPDKDGALLGVLEYRPEALDRAVVEGMARHFQALLGAICGDTGRKLSALPMMDAAERLDLVERWNRSDADQGPAACVHELISARAAVQPEAIAIAQGQTEIAYAGLDSLANRLARRLQQLGAGPGGRVGILLDRSIEMVASMIAAWKCGAAYVPLDPAYPPDRLSYIAADSEIAVLVTRQELARPAMHGATLLLDSEWPEIARLDDSPVPLSAAPDDLAYLIYTSGSTGRPKGVEISHAALLNLLRSMGSSPGLSASDTWVAVTSPCFDISTLELFLPLIAGARVVLASREDILHGERLGELLESSGATVLQATPSVWRLLIECGWQGRAGLKGLCGGEAMPSDLARDLLARGVRLWNVYGPTETTVWSAIYEVREAESPVPIGFPVDNTQLYILDGGLNPVPAGVIGELFIGGSGLARGYRNLPQMTAERFVPDPFANIGRAARMYRTGDLARRRLDGAIEFLGRLDHQVKIRGYRVEPGEIETLLRECPGVQDALVIGRNNGLLAYVAAGGVSEAALRQHVGSRVPEYMVPGQFIMLRALPRLPNGKIDRHALPEPQAAAGGPARAPHTAFERLVADVWSELLGRASVGLRDNFFEIGGHSLAAVRARHRLEQKLNREVRLIDLFRYPTVESLAGFLAGTNSMEAVR